MRDSEVNKFWDVLIFQLQRLKKNTEQTITGLYVLFVKGQGTKAFSPW